jgi:hypothetical protein
MSSALTNFYHSFVNTLVHIWTVVLSWCFFRQSDVAVDLEQGIRRPQDGGQPPSAAVNLSSFRGKSNFVPEYAASPFPHTAYPPSAVKHSPYLPQTIAPHGDDTAPELGVPNSKSVDGRIVPTSLPVEDDMSASGSHTRPPYAACDVSGSSIVHNDNVNWKSKDSPCRSSISTSTSTPSFHVPTASSFRVFRDDQNLRCSRRGFIGRPLSPLTFPSRHRHGKGHKRAPLATITNISHVMGPSSPVIETFIIPKASSAIPLMAPMTHGARSPPPTPPLICGVVDQVYAIPPPRDSASSSPCLTPSVISTLVVLGPALIPATPTSERSLRRVPAFDNLHSPSPSRKSQKASPSPSPRKRPVSSVVWFKNPSVTPTTPLRIAKRCAGLSPRIPTPKTARKAGVTEEELEEEVLAVKKAFATVRKEGEDDDGAARERFNRASVWTTRTSRSSVFQLDEHMRNILDTEEADDDDSDEEGYGEELPSSSLMMRSPPPPYPLSPPAVHTADKNSVYKMADSLPPVSESTELPYLRSPTPFESLDESLDDLLLSFEDLIASMPSRLKTPDEMRHTLAEKEAKVNGRTIRGWQAEKGEVACLLVEDKDRACRAIVEKVDGVVAQSERDRNRSDDFELDAYVEAPSS